MDVDEALAIADRSGAGLVTGPVARVLAEAIGRVRALHRPDVDASWWASSPSCAGCEDVSTEDYVPWPCPTIRALSGEDR